MGPFKQSSEDSQDQSIPAEGAEGRKGDTRAWGPSPPRVPWSSEQGQHKEEHAWCRAELTPREGQTADRVLRMLGAIQRPSREIWEPAALAISPEKDDRDLEISVLPSIQLPAPPGGPGD